MKHKTYYIDQFGVGVPIDKIESIIKAFSRLAEIAKEEKKDTLIN